MNCLCKMEGNPHHKILHGVTQSHAHCPYQSVSPQSLLFSPLLLSVFMLTILSSLLLCVSLTLQRGRPSHCCVSFWFARFSDGASGNCLLPRFLLAACFMLVSSLTCSSTLKVDFQWTAWRQQDTYPLTEISAIVEVLRSSFARTYCFHLQGQRVRQANSGSSFQQPPHLFT